MKQQEHRSTKRHSVVIAGLAGAGLVCGVAVAGGIIGTLPVIAYATGGVAAIGTNSYGTLQEAIADAQDGDTIQMLASTNLTETIAINKSLTINLNGKSIEATNCRALWVKNGTVTLSGSGTVSATGNGLDESSSVIRVGDETANEEPASLTIGENVTVSSNRCYGVTVFGKNADSGSGSAPISLVVNGKVLVTASGEADAAISGNGNDGLSRTSIIINDGAVVSATNQTGIYHPGAGTLTINGGKVTGPTAVYIKSGTLNVTGGTLEATGDAQAYAYYGNGPKATGDALVVDSCGYPNGAPAVSISAGTFVSAAGADIGDYTYGDAPQAEVVANTASITLPDGFIWTASEEGTYVATKAESIASVTHGEASTSYATLSEAMGAVQDGDTLTLLHDTNTPNISYKGDSSFVLDLNGKSIGERVTFWSGTVTIKNGTINGRLDAYDSSVVTLDATANVHGQVVVWGDKVFGEEGCKTPTLNVYGKVTNTGDSAISTNGTDKSGANINIYDGAEVESTDDIAIYQPSGNVTVSGGTITGMTAIYQKSGTLTITGGTITGIGEKSPMTHSGNGATATGDAIVVESCDYPNSVPQTSISGDPTVSSTHAAGIGDYVSEGAPLAEVVSNSNSIPLSDGLVWIAAADGNGYEIARSSISLISNGTETGYASLADAIQAAQDGDEVKLLDDLSLGATQEINKSLTIDLNGKNIVATDARALWIKNGNVSIIDTSEEQEKGTVSATGENLDKSSSVIRVGDRNANGAKAKLTVGEGVTVASDHCYGVTVFGVNDTDNDKTTADIEVVINGNISVTGDASALSGNGTDTLSATTITIGSNARITAAGNYAIYHPGKGALTVNGYVEGTGGIEVKGGTVAINNGATIKATASEQSHTTNDNGTSTSGYAIAAVNNPNYAGDPAVTINGGTIDGKVIILADHDAENTGLVVATSNEIATDPDYKWIEGSTPGTYALVPRTYVAQVGDDTYEDFASAIAAAQPSDTVKLLDNVHLDATYVITKDLVIDLNGHDIEAINARALWIPSGDVSIVDTSTGDEKGTISANLATPSEFPNSSSVIRVGDEAANGAKAKLTVGEGVTVASDHCYGVTVFGVNDTDSDKTTADIEAVINGNISVTGDAPALSGNGTDTLSATTITIGSNARITAAGNYAVYHPGKGTLTVNGYVEGTGGIEVKGGTVTINNGATIKATASEQSHTAYNNGASTSGYAIAAVNNPNYAGDPAVTINGGAIDGKAVILADYDAENTGTVTATSNEIATDPDYKWVEGDTLGTYKLVPKAPITSVEVTGTLTYNGAAQTPTVVVKAGTETLDPTEYTLSYTSASEASVVQDAKEYVVTATAKETSSFTGSAMATFQVAPKNIDDDDVSLVGFDEWVALVTEGQPVTQNISLTFGNTTLDVGTDYTIEYANNVQAGTATMTVTGKGNYCGTITEEFTIQSLSLANATITLSQDSYTYDGTEHKPAVTVTMTVDGTETTLTEDKDYELSYSGNQNAGEATAIVTGLSPYSGASSKTFTIEKASVDAPVATTGLVYDATEQSGVPASADELYALTGDVNQTNAGDYVTTAVLSDSANYKWSDDTSESKSIDWSIAQAPVTIAANNKSKVQGATDPELTATVTGLKGTDTIQYDLMRDAGDDVGSYDINVVCEATQYSNYAITLVKGTFTITDASAVKFRDVTEHISHHEDIDWLAANGISVGWPVENDPDWAGWRDFRPGNEVIRADMAAFLFRLGKLSGIVDDNWQPKPETKAKFKDVNESTSHCKEIWWLAETEISVGWKEQDGSRTFRPSNSIIRQDMAAFLYRLAVKTGQADKSWSPQSPQKVTFKDVNESTSHYKEIWWLAETEVSFGWKEQDGSRTFRGMTPIIRQDMAAFLHRLAKLPKVSE